MATNRRYEKGDQLKVVPTNPTVVTSGDPVLLGRRPGVALTDEDADGEATVQFNGVFDLSVRGHSGAANAAINIGDTVFYDTTNDELDVDTAGVPYGTALEAVASGATTVIQVAVGPADLA